jgi:LacI family transcriptional regulator, galactose operon repressor
MAASRVTLREVAALAGVNPATVSRVLNSETLHLVRPETARRVEAAARRLDYQPNRIARSLRTRRSHSIGVILPDLTNPLFPPLVRGIEDVLAGAGYTPLLTNTDGDPERERRMFEALRGRQVDGFIMATAESQDTLISGALDDGVPLVLVTRALDRDGVFAVVPDDRRGIQQAVEHLAALGHRSIAHLAGPQVMSTGLLRYRGFLETMAACGLEVPDQAVVYAAAFTEEAGADAARELLTSWPDCTAIVAANDLIALGVYSVAAELGLACPADLSVVGFNDMPFADKFAPPLTTIHIPVYELGTRAAELLLERLESEAPVPRTILVETRLVTRGSTASPNRQP